VLLVVVLILAAGVYFIGQLLYLVVGGGWSIWRAGSRARAALARECGTLPAQELRRRLLQDPYLSDYLRNDASVREFLSRVARGDEVALAREYPKAKLYKLLVRAELAAGGKGRPEAVDAISEISGLLQELARRATR